MSAVVRPPPHPFVSIVAHRVYAFGHALGAPAHHESAEAEPAHAAALALSAAHPLQRFEVRTVPDRVPSAKGGPGMATAWVPNDGLKYESVVALYQAGAEIPIT